MTRCNAGTARVPRRDQDGMTLVEVLVAMGLMAAIAAVFFPLLLSATSGVRRLQAHSEATDDLRVALTSISRELRSAICVAEPAAGSPPSPTLRFTTWADNRLHEVTYRLTGDQLRRQVTTGEERITATGLVASASTFRVLANTRSTVVIDLRSQPDPPRPARQLATTVVGRNAWRGC